MWIKVTRVAPPGENREYKQEAYFKEGSFSGMAQIPVAKDSLDLITCLMFSQHSDYVLETPEEILSALSEDVRDLTKRPE